jgi:hypothetical protein
MRGQSFYLSALALAAGSLAAARAEFTPITLAPDSFNQDIVVERDAIHAPVATTASMDGGTANTGFGWYETGYNQNSPDSGLPAAGSTVTSLADPSHTYTFAASYTANNALLVDTNITTGTLTLTTPATLAAISLLTAAGHGPATNTVVIHYVNGSSETNRFTVQDWFGTNAAVTANGRLDVTSLGFGNVGSGNPNLYSVDVPLTRTGSAVQSVEVQNGGTGDTHTAVFAVSGAASAGADFTPLAVTGYNQDMVVEASAPQALTALNATTASMDTGSLNTGASWYERGYNTNALTTGLPPAGSTVTNASAPDHVYVLPGSYGQNDAVLVDADNSGSLHFSTPARYSTLSFLTAAGGGAVTVAYVVNHADGTTDTGTFTSPDWFNNANAAFIANGRVNVASGLLDSVNGNNPRLYPADITLSNTNSPISSVDLSLSDGTGHAAVFAVSGSIGNVAPLVATQPVSVTVLEGSAAQFTATSSGTLPFTYAWQSGSGSNFVNLQNGTNFSGANSATLNIASATLANAGQYRLAITNVSGSTFSVPVTLTVLSATPSVLSPADTITGVGGTTPDAETVDHAIDQNTQKYLNFGTDGDQNPPFVGPAGFVVTPTLGADASGTVVTAIRIYTANDAPERDPASFTLEGSNNGTNFTTIASGALALPDARNASGATIDPLTQALQEVRFNNSIPYKSYRVLFPHVKNDATANSVQVGEVELLGTVATGSTTSVSINQNTDGTLTITSSAPGRLQSTTALVSGGSGSAWTDEGAINGSVTVTPTGKAKFYRVLAQ